MTAYNIDDLAGNGWQKTGINAPGGEEEQVGIIEELQQVSRWVREPGKEVWGQCVDRWRNDRTKGRDSVTVCGGWTESGILLNC